MVDEITLKHASTHDVEGITNLLNLAYRGEYGWTKETDIVSGERANLNEIMSLINNPGSHMLVASKAGVMVACICVEENKKQAYIGSFAVVPELQNSGIGKIVLNLAENFASYQLGSTELLMVVISQRKELVEYYERRGYRRTGEAEEYPVHLNVGMPIVEGLTVEYISKNT